MANEVAKVEEKAVAEYGAGVNLGDFFADELDGLTPSFERIKIPAGGGLAFEVPGNDPESPDSVKEFKAVILYHHPINCYYKEEYTGGNNPPDCGSMDGHVGIEADTGEVKNCAECEFSKFGTGKNGAKACKQKRRIYLLREGEALPIILSLPTGSLGELSKYIVRVRAKYAGTYCVVTKFTLKKAQNSGGINYSQAVFAIDRALTEDELKNIVPMCEQVKALSKKVTQLDEE
jgi:hypothetical protein